MAVKTKEEVAAKLKTLTDGNGKVKAVASLAYYFGHAFEGDPRDSYEPVKVTEVKGMTDRDEIGQLCYEELKRLAS